jgi:hypothetical protein
MSRQAEWPASRYSRNLYTILWPSMYGTLKMAVHEIFRNNELDAQHSLLTSVLNKKEIHYARNHALRSPGRAL